MFEYACAMTVMESIIGWRIAGSVAAIPTSVAYLREFSLDSGPRSLFILATTIIAGIMAGLTGMVCYIIKLRRRLSLSESALVRRVQQLKAISELGTSAISTEAQDEWLHAVTASIAEIMDAQFVKVLQLQSNGDFLLRSGFGWSPEMIGQRRLGLANGETQADEALRRRTPVIIEDYDKESRYMSNYLYRRHGVRSGIAIPILGSSFPWGVLSVYYTHVSDSRSYDIFYLHALANLIGGILEKNRLIVNLRDHVASLATSDQRKDDFLAMIAHELRNPLSAIQTSMLLLSRSADAKTLTYVEQAVGRNVDHLHRLIDDISDVSRIIRGKIDLQKTRINIETVVHEAVEQSRSLIDSRKHRLLIDVPGQEFYVSGDRLRLSQILSNLLNNAAKYTNDGGDIRLRLHGTNDVVYISISDNGIGINPELLPTIFHAFTQGNQNVNCSQGGLGVGLAVVHTLVHMHGGKITIDSHVGKGSDFTIELPVYKGDTEPMCEESEHVMTPSTTNRKVLVVDDNRDAADSISMLLTLDGYESSTAYNGNDAVAVAMEFCPDAIVLDIGLPGINGYDVASHLRTHDTFKSTFIVAVTGYGRDEDKQMAMEAGFDRHLTKPVKYERLQEVLQEYFDK